MTAVGKFLSFILLICIILFSGCGKKPEIKAEDSKEFGKAIEDYMKTKNYGMAVSSFEELDISGDKASAVCRLNEAENLYAIKVRWSFDFNKNNGKWEVSSHTVK